MHPELAGRHSEAPAELLSEVILRIESAQSGNLGDSHVASLEQSSGLLQTLLFEELAQEFSRRTVKPTRHILTSEAEVTRNSLDGKILVVLHPLPNALH